MTAATSTHDLGQVRFVRFGVFEADLDSCELRKQGRKLKLQTQPCQVLKLLLEHPGEVITREEFRKRLWPEDTFVDFDHSLNTAMRRLREVLNDSPDNAIFIETLQRRGYRFIAPVTPVRPLELAAEAVVTAGRGRYLARRRRGAQRSRDFGEGARAQAMALCRGHSRRACF